MYGLKNPLTAALVYVRFAAFFLLIKIYEAALSNWLYLTEFLTDFGQVLDSKSYDQA